MTNITFTWCVIVLMDLLPIGNGRIVSSITECDKDNSRCYVLYSTSPGVTWDEAYNECRNRSQDLATILSENAQDIVQKFSGSPTIDFRHAWIVGKSYSVWFDLEDIHSNLIFQTSGSGKGDCAALYVIPNPIFKGQPCDTQTFGCICQTNTFQIHSCKNNNNIQGYNISGICHIIPNKTFSSWSDARDHCVSEYGGSLAYSVLRSQIRTFNGEHSGKTFWIGFNKRPEWKWISQDSVVPVTFSQWAEGEGSEEGCMYIDLNKNSDWGAKPCDQNSSIFICSNTSRELVTTTTITITAKTAITTKSPTTTTTSSRLSTLSTHDDSSVLTTRGADIVSTPTKSDMSTLTSYTAEIIKSSEVITYLVIGIAVGITITILVVIVIIFSRRHIKRRLNRTPQPPNTDNNVASGNDVNNHAYEELHVYREN